MSDNAISLYQSSEITVFRPPEEVLAEAQRAAKALKDVVVQTKAAVKLGQSEHLKVEAWQTLGHFYGLTARVRETRFCDYGGVQGWEAVADLYCTKSGALVSTADAMCLNDEEKWSTRTKYEWQNGPNGRERVKVGDERVPMFQLRSMAQTRAISKVHSNVLKWVVVLAGYNPTPAEEMDDSTDDKPARPMPQRKAGISEAQWKRLFAIGCDAVGKDELVRWLTENGVDPDKKGADIGREKYDSLVAALEQTKGGTK
jgi:hypothetical protein